MHSCYECCDELITTPNGSMIYRC
ncbi:hypothetical protein [Veillonella montpellierensis]